MISLAVQRSQAATEQTRLIPPHINLLLLLALGGLPAPGAGLREPLLNSANLRLVLGDFMLFTQALGPCGATAAQEDGSLFSR